MTKSELIKSYGEPTIATNIVLSKNDDGTSLYEYQGDLYKFIPPTDSIINITEYKYVDDYKRFVVWFVQPCNANDTIKILDHLSWDERYVVY